MTGFLAHSPDGFAPGDTSQARLEARVHQCLQTARQHYPALPVPGLWFDLRGRSAGQAHYGRGGLRFNMTLYAEQPDAFLHETVPHEMAHWVVHHVFPGRVRPHGWQWQRIMTEVFGLPPRVTHCFDVTRSSPAPYLYQCRCRIHRFTKRRHLNERRGSRYRCRHCGDLLIYNGMNETPGSS